MCVIRHIHLQDDALTDEELTRTILSATLNIAEIFRKMDTDNNGVLNQDELARGFITVGLNVGKARVLKYMASMDIDGNREVDYREFLRKLSSVSLRDITRTGWDEAAQLEDIIKAKLREKFDDAKQANSYIFFITHMYAKHMIYCAYMV